MSLQTHDDDLVITGALYAGNLVQGSLTVTPTPSTPTSIEVEGLNLRGEGEVLGFATANTTVPGLRVLEVSVSNVTANGMTIWIYRTNNYPTIIRWFMWRERT